MAILTQSGRAAMAASIKVQPIHLAWGNGSDLWEDDQASDITFSNDQITLPHAPIKELVVQSQDQQITYQAGIDYQVDSITGIIDRIDTGSILLDATVHVTYIIDTPPEETTATGLLNEVGRRTVDEVLFCVPDENGDLITPTGRFTASNEPTNNLHLRFTFDFEDSPTETIRELGIMVGTEMIDGLPAGQRYFSPAEIANPGILLVLEHSVPLVRTVATRETFSFVVTF